LGTKEKIKDLLFAIECIHLTTLSGDDTDANVQRLCFRALHPLRRDLMTRLKGNDWFDREMTCAAVCVHPFRVADCVTALHGLRDCPSVAIASVATGFPSGQYSLTTRLSEIEFAIYSGAQEVIDMSLALSGEWDQMYDQLRRMRLLCDRGGAQLKVITSAGELGSLDNVYKVCTSLHLT